MIKIDTDTQRALYGVSATRSLEHALQKPLPPHTLMQRAGLAIARLAQATAPHARCIWLACGAGNNGGDGLEAACQLHLLGKNVVVTWLGQPAQATPDSLAAYQKALQAGVAFSDAPPPNFDFCIDALLGIGASDRAPQGTMAAWIALMNQCNKPILAVDLPTGLNADSGTVAACCVRATHTLCLLTLKPGLYTAHGRDVSGTVWLDDLGLDQRDTDFLNPTAYLNARPRPLLRFHASHKGSYGDVAIVGGSVGMTGAALLAASAALHAGAGRVFVCTDALQVDISQPELMFRPFGVLDLSATTVVCGCGGADQIDATLGRLIASPAPLVLDADALNALAGSPTRQAQLRLREVQNTVLTPHPLEAARLLKTTVQEVQSNRLQAAQQLVAQFACTVVLKGSGTVIAAPGQVPFINPTGNARLATPGSGDVLAGLIGAQLASGLTPFLAAKNAVFHHGQVADQWPLGQALSAGVLAKML